MPSSRLACAEGSDFFFSPYVGAKERSTARARELHRDDDGDEGDPSFLPDSVILPMLMMQRNGIFLSLFLFICELMIMHRESVRVHASACNSG